MPQSARICQLGPLRSPLMRGKPSRRWSSVRAARWPICAVFSLAGWFSSGSGWVHGAVPGDAIATVPVSAGDGCWLPTVAHLCSVHAQSSDSCRGGLSDVRAMNDEIEAMTVRLKPAVEKQLGETFATFEPISYKQQVVAGMNYEVKIRVDKAFVYAKVHKPLPHIGKPPSLMECRLEVLRVLGGFSETREMSEEVKEMTKRLESSIEDKLGRTFSTFEPVSYKQQVVAGMNYQVRIKVDGGSFVQAKIHKPLPHTGNSPSLMGCKFVMPESQNLEEVES